MKLPVSRRLARSAAVRVAGLTTLLAASPLTQAQQADAPTLAPVFVTATRTATRVDEVVADVTVLERADIERATGRTLTELLAQQPGIQFASNGGLGKSSSLFVRGLESRHVLLLIDGVRYGSATLGTPNWDNLPVEDIERIEIVRGPLSGLYGSDAVGGVVQVFTRRGTQGFKPNASLTVGSEKYGQVSGGARFGAGAFDGAVQLSHTRNDGFSATNAHVPFGNYNPDDDGFKQSAANLRLGWAIGGGWRADAQALQSRGTTQYDDGLGADARSETRTELQSIEAGGPVLAGWRTLLRVSRSKDALNTLASASPFSSLGVIETVQRQFTWENTVDTPAGTVLALAERIEQDVSRPGSPFAVSDRSITGVALGLNGHASAHSWQANLRRDKNSQFGDKTTGSLGYGIDVSSVVRLGASFGTSFVAPSFNQLYFPGFGNPLLQPEEGRSRELSVRFAEGGQQLRAAYFRNNIDGFITPGPLPSNTDARIAGFSLAYDGRAGRWSWGGSIDRIDPVNASPSSANYGRQLARRAKDSAKATADVDLGSVNLGATVTAFGPRFDNAANTTRLGGYGTLDLRADWKLAREWSLGLRLNNLADKAYETVYGYNQPGREAYLTLRYAGL